MFARTVYLLGLAAIVGACAKSSTTTDGMPAPAKRDTMSTSTQRVDTARVKPDTLRMPRDTVRRDSTSMSPGQ